jgi:hypothetical protein
MKKMILMAAVALLSVSAANAQEFNKGDWAVNAGIGIDDPIAFGGSVEYGLVDNTFNLEGLTFGVGAELGYASQSALGIKASLFAIGVRAPFHYSPVENLDLYSAPTLLLGIGSVKVDGFGSVSNNDFEFGWTIIGARYFFTPGIGAFAELGTNTALCTSGTGVGAGITFRF